MHSIDVLQTIRVAVFVAVCLGLLLCLAVWTGRRLRASREGAEARARYDAWLLEERKRRLARLLQIADAIEAAPEHERQRLYREADALGFINQAEEPPTPKRAA